MEEGKRLLFLTIVLAMTAYSAAQTSGVKEARADETAQGAYPAPTNLKVLPRDMTGEQVHNLMEQWTRELGVRCAACHEEEQQKAVPEKSPQWRFAEDSKPMKEAARVMYTMTGAINRQFIARINNSRVPVTCGTCHHGRVSPESSLPRERAETSAGEPVKTPQSQPCFQCHEQEKAAFSLPFRHKVEEGLITCTDCHEPHGTSAQMHRMTPVEERRVCTKCHSEIAGHFGFEHAVVKAEGCTACHVPHGGPARHMLNRAKVDTICLLCHFPSRAGVLNDAHDFTTQPRTCTDCHTEIHGSNVSAFFLRVNDQ